MFGGETTTPTKPDRVPDPETLRTCGLLAALSTTLTLPVRGPNAVGVNVTEMVQDPAAGSVLGVNGQLELWAKSPVAPMLVIARGMF